MTKTLKLSDNKPTPPLKAPLIAHASEEIFQEGRFKMWKKGQITNPKWLKRENGSDFICVDSQAVISDLEQYLAQHDPRLAVQDYNCYGTGFDKAGNEMVSLYYQDDEGNNKKLAIIVCTVDGLAMQVVELVEKYCGEVSYE